MGDLLRCYWHPIAAVTEFEDFVTKPIRLLGEDLTLYRDRSGKFGLLGRHCPHRNADMTYGIAEDCGLRCSYHGWLFDETGKCLEQPYEDVAHPGNRFKESTSNIAYEVREAAGLVWAYLGTGEAPEIPIWEPFTYSNGYAQIVFSTVPCNWLQCQENSIDPVHNEWLHRNWPIAQMGWPKPYSRRHLKIGIDEFEFGLGYYRLFEGETEETSNTWNFRWLCVLPNLFITKGHFEWRVPIDDENTLSVVWHSTRVPAEQEPYEQKRIPFWYAPIVNPETGRWITTHVLNQDFVGWVGQGAITDRTHEHLGRSDRGVIMLRNQLVRDMESIASGSDPKGIIRDPDRSKCIELPGDRRGFSDKPLTKEEWITRHTSTDPTRGPGEYFSFLAGQPEEIRKEFIDVMGI